MVQWKVHLSLSLSLSLSRWRPGTRRVQHGCLSRSSMAVYHRTHSLWWSATIPDFSMLSTLCCSALYYSGSKERVPNQWHFSLFLFWLYLRLRFSFRRASVFPASVGSASSVGADHWPLTFPQQSSVTANQLPYIPRCSTVRHVPGRCHACYRLVWSMAIEEGASPARISRHWDRQLTSVKSHFLPPPSLPLTPREVAVNVSPVLCLPPPPPPPPLLFLKLDSRVKVHQPAMCYSS